MPHVTRKDIAAKVARIVHRTCVPLSVHVQSQMPGRLYRIETANESRNISPLLNPQQMMLWLDGFEKSLDEIRYFAQDEINQRGKNIINHCASEVTGAIFCPCQYCQTILAERRANNGVK